MFANISIMYMLLRQRNFSSKSRIRWQYAATLKTLKMVLGPHGTCWFGPWATMEEPIDASSICAVWRKSDRKIFEPLMSRWLMFSIAILPVAEKFCTTPRQSKDLPADMIVTGLKWHDSHTVSGETFCLVVLYQLRLQLILFLLRLSLGLLFLMTDYPVSKLWLRQRYSGSQR